MPAPLHSSARQLRAAAGGQLKVESKPHTSSSTHSLAPSCTPLLIATYNPEEGELREGVLDRFAIGLRWVQVLELKFTAA